MGEAAQELVAAVVEHDRLGDHAAERRHALGQPRGHAAAMERQIGAAGATHTDVQYISQSRVARF